MALSRGGPRQRRPGLRGRCVGWALPLLLVAVWPSPAMAFVAFAIIGLANPLVDVNTLTLMQRSLRSRCWAGVRRLESVVIGAMALGALLMPLLVELVGPALGTGHPRRAGSGRCRHLFPRPGPAGPHGGAAGEAGPGRSVADLPAAGPRGSGEPRASAHTGDRGRRSDGDHRRRAGRPVLPDRARPAGRSTRRGGVEHHDRGRLLRRDRPAARRTPDRHRGGHRRCGAARVGARGLPGRGRRQCRRRPAGPTAWSTAAWRAEPSAGMWMPSHTNRGAPNGRPSTPEFGHRNAVLASRGPPGGCWIAAIRERATMECKRRIQARR